MTALSLQEDAEFKQIHFSGEGIMWEKPSMVNKKIHRPHKSILQVAMSSYDKTALVIHGKNILNYFDITTKIICFLREHLMSRWL